MIDVNAVIDNICNKIGTTADILVPELARYKVATESEEEK